MLASDKLIVLTVHQGKEKKKKKRAKGQGLKFREASELEKQKEYEANTTKKILVEITLSLGCPVSKRFRQKYTIRKIL